MSDYHKHAATHVLGVIKANQEREPTVAEQQAMSHMVHAPKPEHERHAEHVSRLDALEAEIAGIKERLTALEPKPAA